MVRARLVAFVALATLQACAKLGGAPLDDVVILHGRVMDPESGFDAVSNVAILGGKVRAIGGRPHGRDTIDASGLVVAPGFIDLHQHAQHPLAYAVEAAAGITSAFELEDGTGDVDRWYDERAEKAAINYGVSIGGGHVRMVVMHDTIGRTVPVGDAANREATAAEYAAIMHQIEHGLKRGAVAVGFPIGYTPGASPMEILDEFRIAARYNASCHVHMRDAESDSDLHDIEEVIAASLVSGAPVHIVHMNSSAQEFTPRLLRIVAEARAHGLDITTEMYPYTAGMSEIEAIDVRETRSDEWFARKGWPPTGERLTRESFARYHKQKGFIVWYPRDEAAAEAWVRGAVRDSLPMFASDGVLNENGHGHPRVAGTFARILGRYVREQQDVSLMSALRRMTLAPAQRLERRVPEMRDKGRLRAGADADLVLFDPARIIDRATYREPTLAPVGIPFVLVNGVAVVRDGRVQTGVFPGRPVRASVQR